MSEENLSIENNPLNQSRGELSKKTDLMSSEQQSIQYEGGSDKTSPRDPSPKKMVKFGEQSPMIDATPKLVSNQVPASNGQNKYPGFKMEKVE